MTASSSIQLYNQLSVREPLEFWSSGSTQFLVLKFIMLFFIKKGKITDLAFYYLSVDGSVCSCVQRSLFYCFRKRRMCVAYSAYIFSRCAVFHRYHRLCDHVGCS